MPGLILSMQVRREDAVRGLTRRFGALVKETVG